MTTPNEPIGEPVDQPAEPPADGVNEYNGQTRLDTWNIRPDLFHKLREGITDYRSVIMGYVDSAREFADQARADVETARSLNEESKQYAEDSKTALVSAQGVLSTVEGVGEDTVAKHTEILTFHQESLEAAQRAIAANTAADEARDSAIEANSSAIDALADAQEAAADALVYRDQITENLQAYQHRMLYAQHNQDMYLNGYYDGSTFMRIPVPGTNGIYWEVKMTITADSSAITKFNITTYPATVDGKLVHFSGYSMLFTTTTGGAKSWQYVPMNASYMNDWTGKFRDIGLLIFPE